MEIIKDVQRQIVLWIILAVTCLSSLGIAVFVNHANNIVQWSTFFIIAGSIFGFFVLLWWFWILFLGGRGVRYLHTMVRVSDLEKSLDFYCNKLGLKKTRHDDYEAGRFSLIFLAPEGQEECPLELTHNWDPEPYDEGRNFGHVAYEVDDIYATCQGLMDAGVVINRPPRDGRMAFIRSPDNISEELLQKGEPLAITEPWSSMENIGHW